MEEKEPMVNEEVEQVNYENEYNSLAQRFNALLNDYNKLQVKADMYEEWALAYKQEVLELRKILNEHFSNH